MFVLFRETVAGVCALSADIGCGTGLERASWCGATARVRLNLFSGRVAMAEL